MGTSKIDAGCRREHSSKPAQHSQHNKMRPATPQPSVPKFYTTAEQESALHTSYVAALKHKTADLEATTAATGKIQKYTARALIDKPHRVFEVIDGVAHYDGVPSPTQLVAGGHIYSFDPKYAQKVAAFIAAHPSYKVVFMPSGRYGPTTHWCGSFGSTPAYLIAPDGTEIDADSVDDYDIACL